MSDEKAGASKSYENPKEYPQNAIHQSVTLDSDASKAENVNGALDDYNFYIDETIGVCQTATIQTEIIVISEFEIAYDLWRFKRSKADSNFIFSGIYKTGVFNFLQSKGYYKRYRADRTYILIHEKDNIIEQVEISQLRDIVSSYVRSFNENISFNHKGNTVEAVPAKLIETLLNTSHLIFNENALGHLQNHKKPILKDTKESMFFPFINSVVKVTINGITQLEYPSLNEVCVWKEHIIKRDFKKIEEYGLAQFAHFINNVANGQDDRIMAFCTALGYLLHNYTFASKGQAVIAYDEEITESWKPEGGTGKGIVGKALQQLRLVVMIDGKRFDKDDKFCFQNVNDTTQLVVFEDVKPDFDFMRLNSVLTEGWQVEVKNKQSFRIEAKDSPKTYITSNSILKGEGTTVERRQFVLEFSPFYSKLARQKLEPIVHTHGCMFFDEEDWDENEWNMFYTFMLMCGSMYLKEGLKYYDLRTVAANKLRQLTSDDFSEWVENKDIKTGINYNITEWMVEFKNQFYGEDGKFTQRTFNKWLKIYASTKKYKLMTQRSNSINYGTFTPVD